MDYETVLSFSGGLDSVVLLYELAHSRKKLRVIYLDFGKLPSSCEISSVKYHSLRLGIPLDIVDVRGLTSMTQGFASLAEQARDELDVKEYETQDGFLSKRGRTDGAQVSGFLIVVATTTYYAQLLGVSNVNFAITREQTEAVKGVMESLSNFSLAAMALNAAAGSFSVQTPFHSLTKGEIIQLGQKLNVDFEATWSCLLGGFRHCGRCVQCRARRAAFRSVGVSDPTEYEVEPKDV